MAWFWYLLIIAVAIFWIAALVDIIRRRHEMSTGKLAAWILLIVILPLVGTLVYFLAHGASMAGPTGRDRGETGTDF